MGIPKGMGVFAAFFAALVLSSCGGGAGSGGATSQDQASIYTVGTDAPLPSVISCEVNVSGITLNNGATNVSVLSQPQIVDFAQLSGLHQLLDLTAVPTGTYTSATITIASPSNRIHRYDQQSTDDQHHQRYLDAVQRHGEFRAAGRGFQCGSFRIAHGV